MNANRTDTLRLFLALWPDDATRTALLQLQAPMRGRLIPYANLHLTLIFLGQQPISVVPSIKEILERMKSRPIPLTLDRVGYFSRNRIAWVGAHNAPLTLVSLYRELAEGLEVRGIAFNRQHDFKPHLTLARDVLLPPDVTFNPIPWHANQVALVQSTQLTEGSSYEVIASRMLDEEVRVKDAAAGDQPGSMMK
jgi:2'-5' RNA ligase